MGGYADDPAYLSDPEKPLAGNLFGHQFVSNE
jgi:hypothetical protein